jgi:hypothetical protein
MLTAKISRRSSSALLLDYCQYMVRLISVSSIQCQFNLMSPSMKLRFTLRRRFGKFKLFLYLTDHPVMKTLREMEVWLYELFVLELHGSKWLASHINPLLRGQCPQYPLDKMLDGAQSRFGRLGEEKVSY